jgi:hypothetical protein
MVQLENNTRLAVTQLSMQFEQILTGEEIQTEMLKLLGYMQIPLLKKAVMDNAPMVEMNGAGIRLFFKLADIAALWIPQENAYTDKLYQKVAQTIDEVRTAEPLTDKVCEELLDTLLAESAEITRMANEQARQAPAEQAVPVLEEGEGRVEEGGQQQDEVETSAGDKQTPPEPEAGSENIQEASPEEIERLRKLVEALTVGVRIDREDPEGEKDRLRVAAILPSSGEIVLVNRNQEKVGSFDKDDILEELLAGSMSLVEDTLSFDKTLESVIAGSRR